jgi:hypothetical protein
MDDVGMCRTPGWDRKYLQTFWSENLENKCLRKYIFIVRLQFLAAANIKMTDDSVQEYYAV